MPLTLHEIQRYLEAIKKALVGMVYGMVEIEVRGGHIHNVRRVPPPQYMVKNGQPVESNEAAE